MHTSRFHLALACLACLFFVPAKAFGQTAWTLSSTNELLELDLTTSDTEVVGPIDPSLWSLWGPLAQASGTELFALLRDPRAVLYRISTENATITEVGSLGLPNYAHPIGMTHDASGRLWLAAQESESFPALYQIDAETGLATLIGTTDLEIWALAAHGDRLLGLAKDYNTFFSLYEINTETAEMEALVELPEIYGSFLSMDMESPDRLWVLAVAPTGTTPPAATNRIYSVDLNTGETVFLAETPASEVSYGGLVVRGTSSTLDVPALDSVGLALFITLLLIAALTRIRLRPI